jgi:hypothetical protein
MIKVQRPEAFPKGLQVSSLRGGACFEGYFG